MRPSFKACPARTLSFEAALRLHSTGRILVRSERKDRGVLQAIADLLEN